MIWKPPHLSLLYVSMIGDNLAHLPPPPLCVIMIGDHLADSPLPPVSECDHLAYLPPTPNPIA